MTEPDPLGDATSPDADLPVEVLFDRGLRRSLGPVTIREYRGKLDLERHVARDTDATFLKTIQDMFNKALAEATIGLPPDRRSRFYFDYIDSDIENALAFCFEGYSFIGVTLPMVRSASQLCRALAHSPRLFTALKLGEPTTADALQLELLVLLLNSVVSHEYTHHCHGHVPSALELGFHDEFGVRETPGLNRHVQEVDADGFSVYLTLSHALAGAGRTRIVSNLLIEELPAQRQDQILLDCFVVAVGAHYLSRSPRQVTADTVYTLSHPVPASRLHFTMQHLTLWAGQNRPHLLTWMTIARFQYLMREVSHAIAGPQTGLSWQDQVAFLTSEAGRRYTAALSTSLDAYKATLPSSDTVPESL